MQKIIIILGPTASGKSDLAVEIAKKFNGEVISADSRQVYRGMNIGTGKITRKEMMSVPHYLLDVASPRHRFSVAEYRVKALHAIKKIQQKGKLPIICGGTGLYIQAVIDNLIIPEVKPDFKLRRDLEKLSTEKLFAKLKKLDPRRAKNIDQFNRRRLIRALEIVLKTGRPIPLLRQDFGGQTHPNFQPLFIGIKKNQQELSILIKKRLLKRLKIGMIAEVKKLKTNGVSWKRLEEFGLEYRYISYFLQNKISREEIIATLAKKIEQYAKRQMTWWKRDLRIHWIDNSQEAINLTLNFLQ